MKSKATFSVSVVRNMMLLQMIKDKNISIQKQWWSNAETFRIRVLLQKKKSKPSDLVQRYDFKFTEQVSNMLKIKR